MSKGRTSLVPASIEHFRMPLVSHRLASTSSIHPSDRNINTIPGCISFLQSYAQQSSLSKGKELHSWMLRHNLLTSPLSVTSLINMYSKCNFMSYALSVFESLGNFRNVYAYNAIIAGCVGNNMYNKGFKLYLDIRCRGISPDKFTFPCVIKGCSEVVEMRKIHALLFKCGLELDAFIGSALLNCYLKFRAVDDAYKVFDDLPARDVVMCNAMINGFVHIGEFRMALEVFRLMTEGEATPNNFTLTGCYQLCL